MKNEIDVKFHKILLTHLAVVAGDAILEEKIGRTVPRLPGAILREVALPAGSSTRSPHRLDLKYSTVVSFSTLFMPILFSLFPDISLSSRLSDLLFSPALPNFLSIFSLSSNLSYVAPASDQ